MDPSYPISRPSLGPMERSNLLHAFDSGWISSSGEFVTAFEEKFAEFCECKHAVAVSNGTVALHLALRACGVGAGDEVIIPDFSFIATANAVLECGAKPVFADIEADTLCLDAADVARLVTSRTRAIMPVHLYGHPADMDAINAVAKRHGLIVIEDAAEAHGARVYGRRVGGLGDCAAFSFFGNKILTTGEGGMITTNDDALAARCRTLRDHAMSKGKALLAQRARIQLPHHQHASRRRLRAAGSRRRAAAPPLGHLCLVHEASCGRKWHRAQSEGRLGRAVLLDDLRRIFSHRGRGARSVDPIAARARRRYAALLLSDVGHAIFQGCSDQGGAQRLFPRRQSADLFDLNEQDVRKIAAIVKSVWAGLGAEAEACP